MRAKEFSNAGESKDRFVEMFEKFLPLCMKVLKLDRLPKMEFFSHIQDTEQPTFGRFVNDSNLLQVALANRHPNDILRTIAHELQHFKQNTEHRLGPDAGETGSPIENEAHAMAGIVMRHFNKQYPEYLSDRPVVVEQWSQKYKNSINCSNPKGFSQRAHCQGRKKHESVDENVTKTDIHNLADLKGVKWNNEPSFLKKTKQLTGKSHLDDLDQEGLKKVKQWLDTLEENFADGRNPQDKGDSKRYGVPTKASVSTLRKVAKQGGRKGQLAHWMANMKAGRAKKK